MPTAAEICILFNGKAGKTDESPAAIRLRERAEEAGDKVELRVLSASQNIESEARRAAAEGFRVVAAAGGDGTISAVAAGLRNSGAALAVLPMGTFNYLARGLEVPQEVDEAFDVMMDGEIQPLPVGEVNGRVFLNNASFGVYPAILAQREGIYKRFGRSRLIAHWSTLRTVLAFHKPIALKITVDGQTRERRTSLAFIARSAYQLEEYDLDGADCIRDGQFAVFIAPDCSRWQLLYRALRLTWRGMRKNTDFELLCGRDIVIESRRRSRMVALDGESERINGPYRFRVLKDAISIVAPKDQTDGSAH